MTQEHLGLTQRSLETVKQKLFDKAHGFEDINRRARSIQSLISEFKQSPSSADEVLNDRRRRYEEAKPVQKKRTLREIQSGPEPDGGSETDNNQLKKSLEESTVAYIMYKLESSLPNFEVREEQIKDITALLEESHLHAGTGSGKSSVILPITLIAKALTAVGPIAGATVSPELLAKLRTDVEKMNGLLPDGMQIGISECVNNDSTDKPHEDKTKTFFQRLSKTVIGEGGEDKTYNKYAHDTLFGHQDGQAFTFKGNAAKNRPSVHLFKEDDLVFWKMLNPAERLAFTYFDEIHVPRDRNNPYYLERVSTITRKSTEGYLFSRILHGIVASRTESMMRAGEIAEEKGRLDFSKKRYGGEKKDDVYARNERRMLDLALIDWLDGETAKRTEVLLDPVLQQVAESLTLDKNKLKSWFVNQWKDVSRDNLEEQVGRAAHNLFTAKAIQSGVHYSLEGGHVTSRDPMMGILLPRREFMPEVAVALQALEGEVSFISFTKAGSYTSSLEGFIVNYLGGKIAGLSGTLLSPSLMSPSFHKSPLAEFLEKATGKSVYTSETPKPKYIPTPKIYADSSSMNEKLFERIQSEKRQVAIFTFNEDEGRWLLSELEGLQDKRKVIFIPDNMSETQAQKLYELFADTPGAILISTGRVGVGVDIKTSGGRFPDFATFLVGLPFATNQVFQAIGRRRLDSANPQGDFSWFISLDQLKEHPGFKYLEEKDKTKLEKDINNLVNPEVTRQEAFTVLQQVLHESEIKSRQNDWIKVEFDKFYPTALEIFRAELEKEKKKTDGVFETDIMPAISEETRLILDAYLSARANLEPSFATEFEENLFKRLISGLLEEKIRRAEKSGDVIETEGRFEFNQRNYAGKSAPELLAKRKKGVYELLERRLEPYEIRLYLSPIIQSVTNELRSSTGVPQAFTDPQSLENWFLSHLHRFRKYTSLAPMTEETVNAIFSNTSFASTQSPLLDQDQQVTIKHAFFRFANEPAMIYHQLLNILTYAHLPVVRGAGRSGQPDAIVADFKKLAGEYLCNPDNLKDWLKVRGEEYSEMLGATAEFLKNTTIKEKLIEQLTSRDARFTTYHYGNIELTPPTTEPQLGWILEPTDHGTHKVYWQYEITLGTGSPTYLVRQRVLVPSRSIVVQNGVEIRPGIGLELYQGEKLFPIVISGENGSLGLIGKNR